MGGEYIIVKQNQYMRLFRKAGATDYRTAKTLEELGIRPTGIFNRMVDRGVFINAGRDAFYIDQNAAAEFVSARRKRALWSLLLALLVLLVLFFLRGGILR